MATDKKVEKSPAEKILLARRILSIVLVLFGAFVCYYAITNILTPPTLATDKSINPVTVSVFSGLLAVAALAKILIGVMSLTKKGSPMLLRTVSIANLAIVIVCMIMLSGVSKALLWIGVADLILSVLALVFLSDSILRYVREMFGELKKLTWLSRKELFSHTLAVVTFVLVMAAVIYLLDTTFSAGFKLIDTINIG